MAQQEQQIKTAVQKAQDEFRNSCATQVGISLDSMDLILQPIISSCTKDSIAVSFCLRIFASTVESSFGCFLLALSCGHL